MLKSIWLKIFIIILAMAAVWVGWMITSFNFDRKKINSFEECVSAGYPVVESYLFEPEPQSRRPEQCTTPDGKTFTAPVSGESCYVGGCSGQVCSDQKDVVTTCEYLEEYVCYQTAICERQSNGQCGWTPTQELQKCLGISIDPPFEVAAANLKIPWEAVWLDGNSLLVTERPGTLALIKDGSIQRIEVPEVYHIGEGGLMGMALHPEFAKNKFLYLYLTYLDGNAVKNRVDRYEFENNSLQKRKSIIEGIPGASNHNGGRIAFGPDTYLYVTTGDAGNSSAAQDTRSLAGKILRVQDDGSLPSDNPFGNAVYSYGHRNPQGLAFDDKGNLWSTEHGRSGIFSGYDEINLIEKGKNYGWPEIQGNESKQGMVSPAIHSGASKTWAPAGIVFLDGKLFFGGLRGQALYGASVNGRKITGVREYFTNEFGRIRVVVKNSNGGIYIATSNTDGRGKPLENDDRLIKINTIAD